jgi:hypothetical protein
MFTPIKSESIIGDKTVQNKIRLRIYDAALQESFQKPLKVSSLMTTKRKKVVSLAGGWQLETGKFSVL